MKAIQPSYLPLYPPDPPIRLDAPLAGLLSEADLTLGRLDGAATVLPNVDLFVTMYVRQEAVFSSQIEGTQASLTDVLQFEVSETTEERPRDIEEVVNYVRAMNCGLRHLKELSVSLRLIRQIHAQLMTGNATFVPPPPYQLMNVLGNLETFLHDRPSLAPSTTQPVLPRGNVGS